MSETLTAGLARPDAVRVRRLLRVSGVVQGVGFRPFVHQAATSLGLTGTVANGPEGVVVEVEGAPELVEELVRRLREEPPVMATVLGVVVEALEPRGDRGFTIGPSSSGARFRTFLAADVGTCEDCLRDLADPADRRFRHPFVSCTNCGPRFTITTGVPYDRHATTMAGFPLCPACLAEYGDPSDRRFHAQPICCHDCGPVMELVDAEGNRRVRQDALDGARDALRQGRIVAVKGLGGYHLVCDAGDESAVAELRRRKARGDKPFAVMVADPALAAELVDLDDAARDLLTSPQRPIVLLPRRSVPGTSARLAPSVAPGCPDIGVMVPHTPLHVLLLGLPGDRSGPSALVMTSGNAGGEPIVTDDDAALSRLVGLADLWLRHDRPIAAPCDDSVVRIVDGTPVSVRRSRGYAPLPLLLPVEVLPVLAVGADLKSVSCLGEGRYAWLSQHVGDLDDPEAITVFEAVQERMRLMTGVDPVLLASDRHPGYRSTQWARRAAAGRRVVAVQHHHAHVAAVMAEHGLDGSVPVIGVAFDGTGHGCSPGARPESWGGEVLVADYRGFRRVAHLGEVLQTGGDLSVRRPYRMALSHLYAAGVPWDQDLPPVAACPQRERSVVRYQLDTGLGCVPTSSMGRLFDAVASLLAVRQVVGYEAQAAIELEWMARDQEPADSHPLVIGPGGRIDPTGLIRGIVADIRAGTPRAAIAAGFHRSVAEAVLAVCRIRREADDLTTVALGGGVWQNALLLTQTRRLLAGDGFRVLCASQLPANDGGLALGQLMIASNAVLDGPGPVTRGRRSTPCV